MNSYVGNDVSCSLSKGMPQAFLPLYHYVFMNYSTAIAEQIADLHIVLENKSDARFVDGIYKVLYSQAWARIYCCHSGNVVYMHYFIVLGSSRL